MTMIAMCSMCGSAPCGYVSPDGVAQVCRGVMCGVCGPKRDTREKSIAAWNALMGAPLQTCTPPKTSTVRVKWVVWSDPKGVMDARRVYHDEDTARLIADGSHRRTEYGSVVATIVTADVPLAPEPIEVEGAISAIQKEVE